jgi:uncharacterized protein
MKQYQGKTALVTGASSGIGEAFARELAARSTNLILIARGADRLQQIAAELRSRNNIQVTVLPFDLGKEDAAVRIHEEVARQNLQVDLLVNNAGFATHDQFDKITLERDHQQVMVNVTALVDLTHAFLPGMLQRGAGGIINVASTVAFQPTPYMAVYGASKAFVVSFSVALAEEYRGRGIHVLALCPGATATNFFDVAGSDSMAFGTKRSSAQVVATGLRALERGKSVVIDGGANTVTAELAKRLPFALSARAAALITKPKT